MRRIDFKSAKIDEVDIEILTQCEKQEHATRNSVFEKSEWLPKQHNKEIVYERIKKLIEYYLIVEDDLQTYSLSEVEVGYLGGFRNTQLSEIVLHQVDPRIFGSVSVLTSINSPEGATIALATDTGTILCEGIVKIGSVHYQITEVGRMQGSLISRPR
ncbi:MAG TPA: hypothetical protein VFF30_09595 [Nitrososphaerales archaeon]|nr:hypothetical protein [Nitrososphaerales archaeon]